MYAGCIPVILSDEMGLPFEEKIPWRNMTIKWPEHSIGEKEGAL